jgi:hypothetical protein
MDAFTVDISIKIQVRPACLQQRTGEQPHRGRPSRWVETVDLSSALAVYHASCMTLDQVVTAAIAEGFVEDGPVPHWRGGDPSPPRPRRPGRITIEGL